MEEKYKIKLYKNSNNGKEPVLEYLQSLEQKDRIKIGKYIRYLRDNNGYIDEPYSRHVKGKIRELRVDFGRNYHRIFYSVIFNRKIILLHAYYKKFNKIPGREINRAITNYNDTINNPNFYE